MLIAPTIALSAVVGLAVGMPGGDGTILLLPLPVYAAGLETEESIATSLLVVGVTGVVATVAHARAGDVHRRTGAVCGAAGMGGAADGGLPSPADPAQPMRRTPAPALQWIRAAPGTAGGTDHRRRERRT